MTVILVLFFFIVFLLIDHFKSRRDRVKGYKPRPVYTTSGFEHLGCLAQDGGKPRFHSGSNQFRQGSA
jgi:hypothetical protein